MKIVPYDDRYCDDMIFMILQAKDALGRVPTLNDDLLHISDAYIVAGDEFWLAVDETDRVVGSIGYKSRAESTEVTLRRLYVKATLKRRGIGSALLHTVEEHLRCIGKTAVHVHVGDERYAESYQFYLKHGYVFSEHRRMKKDP